jgi:hypothetical protein
VAVIPVPPLEAFKVPLSTTAPVDAVVGLKPVVPALNDVTPVFVKVTDPVLVLTLIPVPATALVTPVLVTVMLPVDALTLIAVPAIKLVTPVLLIWNVPEPVTVLIPVPVVTVNGTNVPPVCPTSN